MTLASLASSLVSIDSINPSLAPNGAGEAEICAHVSRLLTGLAIPHLKLGAKSARPSLVAFVGGAGGKTLMINAHLDTVGLGAYTGGLTPRIDGTKLFGRGSLDTKGALAAALLAIRDVADEPLRGRVLLAAVADEEHSSAGTRAVLERFSADAAVVLEPTDMQLCIAHRGFFVIEVELTGTPGHTALSDGVNAITNAGRVLNILAALNSEFAAAPAHALLGRASVEATLIEGGRALFNRPERSLISIEGRTTPLTSNAKIIDRISEELDVLRTADPAFQATLRPIVVQESYETTDHEEIVGIVGSELEREVGTRLTPSGQPYWTDAQLLGDAGIPTVIIGPRGGGLHGIDEWVDIEDLEALRRVLVGTIRKFCG